MYRAFLARYAHYVLLRVQCFGGMFSEINPPTQKSSSPSKSSPSKPQTAASSIIEKPITSTRLKKECLDAAQVVLKAGLACKLKPMEECENTVVAMERVVSDMIGLTTAVAAALNSALDDKDKAVDRALVKLWCEFYLQELLPQTKAMIKSATPTLDAFGIFLPSRMGTTVSQDLLQKGLSYIPPTKTSHLKEDGNENGNALKDGQDEDLHEKERREGEDVGGSGTTDLTGKDNTTKNNRNDHGTSGSHQNGDNDEVSRGMEEEESMDEYDAEYDEYEYDEDYYYDGEFD